MQLVKVDILPAFPLVVTKQTWKKVKFPIIGITVTDLLLPVEKTIALIHADYFFLLLTVFNFFSQALSGSMKGKVPQTILTDQNMSLKRGNGN